MGELEYGKGYIYHLPDRLRGYLAQRILDQAGFKTWNLSGGYRLYEMVKKDEAAMAAVAGMCTECGKEL